MADLRHVTYYFVILSELSKQNLRLYLTSGTWKSEILETKCLYTQYRKCVAVR